jgi:hypothetical protein
MILLASFALVVAGGIALNLSRVGVFVAGLIVCLPCLLVSDLLTEMMFEQGVHLGDWGNTFVILVFRNPEYARQFRRLNAHQGESAAG